MVSELASMDAESFPGTKVKSQSGIQHLLVRGRRPVWGLGAIPGLHLKETFHNCDFTWVDRSFSRLLVLQ